MAAKKKRRMINEDGLVPAGGTKLLEQVEALQQIVKNLTQELEDLHETVLYDHTTYDSEDGTESLSPMREDPPTRMAKSGTPSQRRRPAG